MNHSPLLLLHGALGAASQLSVPAGLLPGIQAVAIDFPGHGTSTVSAPYSLDLFSSAVLNFMDNADIDRASIFGYSMGGYVALYLAATHPERIRRVVTYGTKLDWSPETAVAMNRMFDPEKIELKVPHFAQSLAALHGDWKAVCRNTSAFLSDLGDGKGLDDQMFSQIACPVTIGWGSLDNVVTEAESRRVAGLIPHGHFVEVIGEKHQLELVNSNNLFKFVEEAVS